MQTFDEEPVTRYSIDRPGGETYYITIGDRAIMAHRPNESAYHNAVEYTGMNVACRLSSKLRARGFTWGQVAYQIQSSGVGHKTVFDDIVGVIRRYIQSEDYLNE